MIGARGRAAARAAGVILMVSAAAPAGAQRLSLPSLEGEADAPAAARPQGAEAVARAIRDQAGGRLREAYRTRGYWPLWTDDRGAAPQAERLLALIESVRVDGLDPDRYDPARLRRQIAAAEGREPRAIAELELALSTAFAELVRDMREPRIEIRYLDDSLAPRRPAIDDVIRQAGVAKSIDNYVARLGWMSPLYARLRTTLLESGAAEGGGADRNRDVAVPPGPPLRAGDAGLRVAMLRARLGLADGDVFDTALDARVRRFQASRGLPADGIAGARTLAALDTPAPAASGERRGLLRVNLERARLLPDSWTRHVVVDAAAARLWYFGEGAEQGTMRVVVGTPETQTPMMAGMVRYATLNPYWNVPVDLVAKRIAPQVLAGRSLASLGYEALSDWTNQAEVIDARTIDWRAVADGRVQPRVRELPGRGNSMGSVKFMFPNELGIYLHDTPQRALFAKSDRHFSNGCVRLEDAPRLGRWLFGQTLRPEGSAPEQHLPLARPVPVYLLYFTASPTGEGVTYVADAYNRDPPALAHFAGR